VEPKIRRKFKSLPITLSTATASATTIRWDDVAGGCLLMGTVNTNATTIQLWASGTTDGTFGRLYDSSGSVADITLAPSATEARIYAVPDAAYGVGALKFVSASTNSTAAVCVVTLKT
jgi:hypothetical protein